MIALDPIRPYLSLPQPIGSAAIASALVFGGCRWQSKLDKADIMEARQAAANLQTAVDALAAKTAEAEAKANAATNKLQDATNEADRIKAEADKRADVDARKLAAAIKRGTVRLSDTWACPAPAGASQAANDAAKARSESMAGSAGRIIAATDADRATIDWLHARWKADRDAVIAAGCTVVE